MRALDRQLVVIHRLLRRHGLDRLYESWVLIHPTDEQCAVLHAEGRQAADEMANMLLDDALEAHVSSKSVFWMRAHMLHGACARHIVRTRCWAEIAPSVRALVASACRQETRAAMMKLKAMDAWASALDHPHLMRFYEREGRAYAALRERKGAEMRRLAWLLKKYCKNY